MRYKKAYREEKKHDRSTEHTEPTEEGKKAFHK